MIFPQKNFLRCLDENFKKIQNSCEDISSTCIDEGNTSPWTKTKFVPNEKSCLMEYENEQKISLTTNFSNNIFLCKFLIFLLLFMLIFIAK